MAELYFVEQEFIEAQIGRSVGLYKQMDSDWMADTAQQCRIECWAKRRRIHSCAGYSRLIKNVCVGEYRKWKVRHRLYVPDGHKLLEEVLYYPRTGEQSIEDFVYWCCTQLPPAQSRTLWAIWHCGSLKGAAKMLGCQPGVVRTRVYRWRPSWQKLWEEYFRT